MLIAGALIALLWANAAPDAYHAFVHVTLLEGVGLGPLGPDGTRVLTLHALVNDALMAVFFALAGKEVWEAVALRNGSLRGRKALTPLIATTGGMAGPVIVYLGLAAVMGSETWDAVVNGWAAPTATDIAFSYLVATAVFGAGHPAVRFLLLLAIADDAAGLAILAVFYPQAPLAPAWLLLSAGAAVFAWLLANRAPRRLDRGLPNRPNATWMRRTLGAWPYVLAGAASWYGFQQAGVHPALGLLPVIPAIPHADTVFGIRDPKGWTDLLSDIEHRLKGVNGPILFLFGLTNAGVELSAMGDATWLVLAGLMIGKPLGIVCMGLLAARVLGLGLPEGMRTADLLVLGCVAGVGFTVSLFIAGVAFEPGPVQDAAKMGALMSFAAAAVAMLAGSLARIRKVREA